MKDSLTAKQLPDHCAYQLIAAYFEDDCADELTNDPIMTEILEKDALPSQPTLSRFFNRMDDNTLA